MQRLKITVKGIVQGVGFRPFIFNLAKELGLAGFVYNDTQGVYIEVEGNENALTKFMHRLKYTAPPLALIDEVLVSAGVPEGIKDFSIKYSVAFTERTAWVAPDTAVCEDCLKDMSNVTDRRFGYAFTNCTNCGPRYSIVKDVPYDRKFTTMQQFTMCPACQSEYDNPQSRRFHAQPNACPICGPVYQLWQDDEEVITDNVFLATRNLIAEGNIVAIKGIGGYHLACDAHNACAVTTLRTLKIRSDKPFAVMCGSLAAVQQICDISVSEEQLLTSPARPIVLLRKRADYNLAYNIAEDNAYLGVMLPYAPVHYLLLKPDDIWVMTSGNISDQPIVYKDNEARDSLKGITAYFLIHNREIYCPTDDSVVRILLDRPYMLRRSRGFAPAPIKLNQQMPLVLAVGGELKNTFCLTRDKFVFISTHIGDLKNLTNYNFYLNSISHYQKLFNILPELVAYDLHREYLSTQYAMTLDIPKLGVQHHHAHIASVLGEHNITEKVIGVALDGTGYGIDGKLWGGEFLIADCHEFIRVGQFKYIPLPGGAKAIKEPWRLGAWTLNKLYGSSFSNLDIPFVNKLPSSYQLVLDIAEKGINSPYTSSAGRLFDIAAVLLGLKNNINYEGQAAIALEHLAHKIAGQLLPYDFLKADIKILDFMPTFAALVQGLQQGINREVLAASFHLTVAYGVAEMVRAISCDTGIKKVAFSGGVCQNMLFMNKIVEILQKEGFEVYTNKYVPCNDGGIAFGQAVIAGAVYSK